eukprot:scaffold2640_cov180-Amphora_coffeaeformis.AAC.6
MVATWCDNFGQTTVCVCVCVKEIPTTSLGQMTTPERTTITHSNQSICSRLVIDTSLDGFGPGANGACHKSLSVEASCC